MSIFVRESTPFDCEVMLEIARANPTAAHWSEAAYRALWTEPQRERIAFVATDEGHVAGFVVARDLAGDWELENIAVHPSSQRRGVAAALMQRLLGVLMGAGAHRLLLEVRDSNERARRLYERHGFVCNGRRPKYYSDPEEDALLFEKNLAAFTLESR